MAAGAPAPVRVAGWRSNELMARFRPRREQSRETGFDFPRPWKLVGEPE